MANSSEQKILTLFVALLSIVIQCTSMVVPRCNNDTLVCGCSKRPSLTLKISGGSSAGSSNWDWMVSFRYAYDIHFCGGSIISEWYIITAAHCLWRKTHLLSEITVCAGTFHLSDSCHHRRSIGSVTYHPLYNSTTLENDIALIRLATPLDLTDSSLTPICLPSGHNSTKYPRVGTDVVAIGWGSLTTGKTPDELQEVALKIIDKFSRKCAPETKHHSILCAGDSGKGVWFGDSGGPLMMLRDSKYWELIGIISFAMPHQSARTGGSFVWVSHFIEFIRKVTTQTTKNDSSIKCSCQCPRETHVGLAYSTNNSLDGCLHACKEEHSNFCKDSNTYTCLGKYCAYSDSYYSSITEISTVNEPALSQCICVSIDGTKSNEQLHETSIGGGSVYNCTNMNTDTDSEVADNAKSTCLLIWSNGDKYIGEATARKRAGFGVMTWSNGDKYIGDWIDDKENGKGNFMWPSGDRYSGEFQDGNLHGYGRYDFADGKVYTGDWVDDLKSGNGTMVWPRDGNYTGQWVNGTRHGYGTHTWPDGDKYIGDWMDDAQAGYGIYTWSSGDKYQGQFRVDMFHGRGIYYFENGDRYVGDWRYGSRTGDGVMFMTDGSIYIGTWVLGKWTGKGAYVSRDGFKYEGEFLDGMRHGKGMEQHYLNGTKYTGDWMTDTETGTGMMTWPNGDEYEGEFKDGEMHGWGTMKYSNGTILEGMWLYGGFLDI